MHAELVGELEALARENAARERLRRLQMLALYRAGGRSTRSPRTRRARLALDELGPRAQRGARALERMILVHDPSLGAAAPERPETRVASART